MKIEASGSHLKRCLSRVYLFSYYQAVCPFLLTDILLFLLCVFASEYMAGGNLYDFLRKHNNTLELSLILRIAIGISKGMDYLHQNNIIHRDLKSANLLIGDGQVSILFF